MTMSPVAGGVFARLLEARTGQQLGTARHWRLDTALMPVLRTHALASLDALAVAAEHGPDPTVGEAVIEALLNNETSFFRDPQAFALLTDQALPALAAARGRKRRLRIWCAGCSTGQEAYSLAMHVAGAPEWEGWLVEIVGTDVSRAAVTQAREGRYSQFEVQRGLPIRQLMRWFEPEGERWRAADPLRRRVQFRQANLLDPAPCAARFDVVLCRNVLLYFSAERRALAFDRLADAIAPDGVLMLGAGETVIGQTRRFVSDPARRGLYRPV